MSVISSRIDRASSDFAANLARMNDLEDELQAALAVARAGGGEGAQKRQREHGKLPVRERIDLLLDEGSPFLGVGGAGRKRPLRRRRAQRRHRDRHRPGIGSRGHDHRERRLGEGRELPPPHREEAPARPGDRPAECARLRLSRRLGRRLPAPSVRSLPRSRSLRPDLLQSGAHERPGNPPGGGGPRFMHRGRRVRAGDERRNHHREEPGHDLPRGAAAREGGDR